MATTGKLIVILAMPRSGTHFLRSVLANAGAVDNLNEAFNPDRAATMPHSFHRFLRDSVLKDENWRFDDATADATLAAWFDRLERQAASRPLLLDIKDDQLRIADWPPTSPSRAPRLLSQILNRGYPLIRLVRRDLLAQYASLELARQTGEWVRTDAPKEAGEAPRIELDIRRTQRHLRETRAADDMIRLWLASRPHVTHLEYETAIADNRLSDQARASIAKVTGIALPADASGEPQKIAPPLRECVANLDAVLASFRGTNLEPFGRLHAEAEATARPNLRRGANGEAVPFILTNFKRPQNLPRLVDICLQAKHGGEVIVLDNAPDDSLGASLDLSSGRVDYRPNRANLGAGFRFAVAAKMKHKLIVAIGDDLFPTPAQLDALIERARADPGRLHGIWGERLTRKDNHPHFANAIYGQDRDIDIVNRIYAFDPAQAAHANALMRRLGFRDWHAAMPSDDVFLSYASDRKPRLHDLGPIEECPTSGAEGIAQWRRDDFIQRRWNVIARLYPLRPARQMPWLTRMIRAARQERSTRRAD